MAGEAGDGALELTAEYVSDNAVVQFQILVPRFPRFIHTYLQVSAATATVILCSNVFPIAWICSVFFCQFRAMNDPFGNLFRRRFCPFIYLRLQQHKNFDMQILILNPKIKLT